MTLSDLEGHVPTADLLQGEFSHKCSADDKI